jgi:NitT/TauT family transport system substrate-binding protein
MVDDPAGKPPRLSNSASGFIRSPDWSRRSLLRAAGAAGLVAPLGLAAAVRAGPVADALAGGCKRHVTLAYAPTGICTAAVPVAKDKGFFDKYDLDVEFVNFGTQFDQSIEAISSGKVDGGVNFILRYLKPLEQGVDIRFIAGTHGGCIRLLVGKGSGLIDVASLRGKTIGVTDYASASKNYYSVILSKLGIDPIKDVEWRVYPADLLGAAAQKGEIDAVADADPTIYLALKNSKGSLLQIHSNTDGDYRNLSCCVIAAGKRFLDRDRTAAAALTRALWDAEDFVHQNPDEAAAVFAQYSQKAPVEDFAAMLRSHTHEHHPGLVELKKEIAYYVEDLKSVGVLKQRTEGVAFANRVVYDVLS